MASGSGDPVASDTILESHPGDRTDPVDIQCDLSGDTVTDPVDGVGVLPEECKEPWPVDAKDEDPATDTAEM